VSDLFRCNEEQYCANLENFLTVATANREALGLTEEFIGELRSGLTRLRAGIAAAHAAADAHQCATSEKNALRESSTSGLRLAVKRIQAQQMVPVGVLISLGLSTPKTRTSPVQPIPPQSLMVTGLDTGVNRLRWDKNGNRPGAVFMVEAREVPDGAFTFVGMSTRPAFDHEGQRPGRRVEYRVKATRSAGASDYSNTAVAYGHVLEVAA
jgi:hypothetical protein